MERAKMEISPPRDRFNLVFFVLLLHGIGTLTPWNMFITAKGVNIFFFLIMKFFSYNKVFSNSILSIIN